MACCNLAIPGKSWRAHLKVQLQIQKSPALPRVWDCSARALPFIKPHAWLLSSQTFSSGALAHVDGRGKCAFIYFSPRLFALRGEARRWVDAKRRQEGSCCFHRVGATINFFLWVRTVALNWMRKNQIDSAKVETHSKRWGLNNTRMLISVWLRNTLHLSSFPLRVTFQATVQRPGLSTHGSHVPLSQVSFLLSPWLHC